MPRIKANGIELEYRETGSPDDPMLLLVSGFSAQMITFPQELLDGLASAGRRVVIFDNRDIGLSTEFTNEVPPAPGDIINGLREGKDMSGEVPYVLNDMAADAAALITALGADKADVMGFSMGGMIVQLMALNHPDKVRTLIPVMTTSGDPSLPPSTPEAQKALTAQPEMRTADAVADISVDSRRVIGSRDGIRSSDEEIRAMSKACFERSDRPMGVSRQYAAILAQPRWHERLSQVKAPTLVLHGAIDPLIRPAAGEDIAKRIPGAEIELFDGWGHDMPKAMAGPLVARIKSFLDQHKP